jgi:hypothetical protein
MRGLNPYKNTANALVKKMGTGKSSEFLRSKIKDAELLQAIEELLELRQHVAFNQGRMQGQYEFSQAIKNVLSAENPNFVDAKEKEHEDN